MALILVLRKSGLLFPRVPKRDTKKAALNGRRVLPRLGKKRGRRRWMQLKILKPATFQLSVNRWTRKAELFVKWKMKFFV